MSVSTSPLLSPQLLARCERLRVAPRTRRTNRTQGEHHTGKGGTSTEFSDYRNYVVGDDVRFIDWNIFSRLNEPYLKLYQHEEEMHVVLILDASASMDFGGKLDLAKQTAAAVGVAGLMGRERVSAYAVGSEDVPSDILPPCTGRVARGRLLSFLTGIAGGGAAPIERIVEEVLRRHRGKGIVYVLSDFLSTSDDGSDLERAFNRLHASGLEPQALQFLAREELEPDVTDDVRFVDVETRGALDVSAMKDLLSVYHEQRWALEDRVATVCRQRGGRFVSVAADESPTSVINDRLVRGGWLR